MTPNQTAAPPQESDALVEDDARIGAAVADAQLAAVERHRRLGEPVVVWRDGRIVEEVPAEPAGPAER